MNDLIGKVWNIFLTSLAPKPLPRIEVEDIEDHDVLEQEPVTINYGNQGSTMAVYQPQERISPNFKQYEITKSSVAAREGIDNTVLTIDHLVSAAALANNVLEPVRQHFGKGFSPNSWFRSEPLERVLCWNFFYKSWCPRRNLDPNLAASWDSYFARKSHPKAEAVDITITGVSNLELFEYIRDNLEYDQLILEYVPRDNVYGGWVHVSFAKENRMSCFSYGSSSKYVTVEGDQIK